jgi:hypothetical protein
VTHELEASMRMKVLNVSLGACKEIINTENFMTVFKQTVDQVGSKETGATGYEDALPAVVHASH